MNVSPKGVQVALEHMGVKTALAVQAAKDDRIPWTVETLRACKGYVDASGLDHPGADLWMNYLKLGRIPAVIAAPADPLDDDWVAMWGKHVCPYCRTRHAHLERCWPQWMKDMVADAPVIAAEADRASAEPVPATVIPFPTEEHPR